MPGILIGTTHLFIYFSFFSLSLFFFFFFLLMQGSLASLLRCPKNMEVKVSQGKFSLRKRGQNLDVQMRSSVCV